MVKILNEDKLVNEEHLRNLTKDSSYLVTKINSVPLKSITILIKTNTAYFIRWNDGQSSRDIWESINNFSKEYSFVEEITDFIK